ncbi:hypothetical protein BYT27DRAFT_7240954 [Phlegmacium glaucopus]|nr:hypothetical protein BYT27DRAFT_7240954 [Phlegmacium glaucopus]
MGNSSSSSGRGHHDESVDYGSLFPQGVYTGPQDWDQSIVSNLIVSRKLAPFYRPLEDYDDSWDDEQILAARKELPDSDNPESATRETNAAQSSSNKSKRPGALKESSKPEAQIYRGAAECPICFLYYPPNINRSRCCDQAICTECFVQIKRNEPTATHMVSEPAACPYCVQDNFGVIYTPPPWRAGLGNEGSNVPWSDPQRGPPLTDSSPPPTHKRRQKSFGADSPEVTTTDKIRPDWESKLEAVRAAVARRANRRIIMRQVGDRLIPVGVTSGRVQVLSAEEAAAASPDGGTRRNRRRPNPSNGVFEQYVGMAGQDLEELMLMEAMRLSLLDHEEHQRKEAEERRKQDAAAATAIAAAGMMQGSGDGLSSPGPGPSTLEASPLSHAKVGSQDSLAPSKKSWSFSRTRTPPPPASNPVTNVPLSENSSATWRNRSAGPAASNSSAFLPAAPPNNGGGKWSSRSITPEPGNRNPASLQSTAARRTSLDNPMPVITLNSDRASALASHISDETNNTSAPAPSSKSSNVNNPLNQQTSSTLQITSSTSTSATDSEALSHGHLQLSLPHLPPLDFETNDNSSKGHPINTD